MNKSVVYFGIAAVVILIIVAALVFNKNDSSIDNTSGESLNAVNEEVLVEHDSMEDCWVAYKGKVYDVTGWLPKHPGSAGAILPYCGTAEEFENAFTEQHGNSKANMLMQVARLMGDFELVGELN